MSDEIAIIKTGEGEIVVELWPDVAPNTVENFKKLARSGFYDGTTFHRIVKGFMIQGGDPLSKDPQHPQVGTGGPGWEIKAEFNERPHVRGVLSMARAENPDSAGSQFFICLANASFLDRQYTGFGKVVRGDEVLTKIGETPTTVRGGEKSKPVTPVFVESIRIVPREAVQEPEAHSSGTAPAQIENSASQKSKDSHGQKSPQQPNKGCIGCLGLLVICFIIGLFGQMCDDGAGDPNFKAGWADGRQIGTMDGLIHSGNANGQEKERPQPWPVHNPRPHWRGGRVEHVCLCGQ